MAHKASSIPFYVVYQKAEKKTNLIFFIPVGARNSPTSYIHRERLLPVHVE